MSRKDTKLPSVGAEFAVLSNLLFNQIETHKSYHNQKGYDLISVNFETNKNARIQVKSNNFINDSSFRLNKTSQRNLDFYVFCMTNTYESKVGIYGNLNNTLKPKFYIIDFDTVEKNAKLDKKGNRYLLLKKISNYNKFEDNWDSIKKFLI